MTDYQSSPSRLARFFKESRDGWKQKAVERQSKLRTVDIKVRDLTKSRDKWKREAKDAYWYSETGQRNVWYALAFN